jgi:hypothetical protein
MTEPPRPTPEALHAYRELADGLSQWAPTGHRLVRERVATLAEAFGPYRHPLETAEDHAARVLAAGQYPFPVGQCLYDDLNNNTGYDHIDVGYGTSEDGGTRITFTGWYPHWAPDGESYERRKATIHCPGWLVTDPDGVERYRRQTVDMAEAVRRERAVEDAAIDALLAEVPPKP